MRGLGVVEYAINNATGEHTVGGGIVPGAKVFFGIFGYFYYCVPYFVLAERLISGVILRIIVVVKAGFIAVYNGT